MDFETFLRFLDVMAFAWGAIWGSFFNVVIYRLPAGLNLAKPPSHCPVCETPLAWYDNIPILGWPLLMGKCRYCKTSISPRYPAIELLTAVLSLALWIQLAHGPLIAAGPDQDVLLATGMTFFFYFYFISVLLCIAFIDLDEAIIPHELTGLGAALGLLAVFLIPRGGIMVDMWPPITWVDALIGMVAGAGIIWLIIKGSVLAYGQEGMGWGDLTLMGMCGLWVGWRGVIFVLFAGSIQGLVIILLYTLWLQLRGKKPSQGGLFIDDLDEIDAEPSPDNSAEPNTAQELLRSTDENDKPEEGEEGEEGEEDEETFGKLAVPFGPFLALAAVEYVLIGEWLLPWILSLGA